MATVQQLQKLMNMQRAFADEDSLESTVTVERLERLIERTEHLIRLRSFMREERRLLRVSAAKVEAYKDALKVVQKDNWISADMIANTTAKRVMLNVGGLMFEATEAVLKRDERSLLALICSEEPPIAPDHDGVFFFDRDWWLFRYILMFLRDGLLPSDRKLLAQLYREASFWRLNSLQKAIEEEKLHLRREMTEEEKKAARDWWRKTPSWWELEKPAPAPPPAPADWWKDEQYNGKSFKPEDMPKDMPKEKPWWETERSAAPPVRSTLPADGLKGMDDGAKSWRF